MTLNDFMREAGLSDLDISEGRGREIVMAIAKPDINRLHCLHAGKAPQIKSYMCKIRERGINEAEKAKFILDDQGAIDYPLDVAAELAPSVLMAITGAKPARRVYNKLEKEIAINRVGGHCPICGCELTLENAEGDHSHDYGTFGNDVKEGDCLRVVCRRCNQYKGSNMHYSVKV